MKTALASTMTLGVLLMAASAAADPAFTAGRPTVSGQINYGIFTGDDGGTDLTPYGFGLGVKGGYTLDSNLYVGGAFDYYFGNSKDFAGGSVSANVWTLQGEVGYDLGVAPNVVIRPKGGIGLASGSGETCTKFVGSERCLSDSESKFSIAPGVQALYSLDKLFLTADARYNIVFGVDEGNGNAFILGAGAGVAF